VSTDADGLLDVLADGRDALIVPRRDARALADAIVRLVDDPALRASLAAGARETAREYDIATFVRRMEALYDILHRESRLRRRRIAETLDLGFLDRKVAP
jgi:glycosyltransferase involved in cell wall biosynthesis